VRRKGGEEGKRERKGRGIRRAPTRLSGYATAPVLFKEDRRQERVVYLCSDWLPVVRSARLNAANSRCVDWPALLPSNDLSAGSDVSLATSVAWLRTSLFDTSSSSSLNSLKKQYVQWRRHTRCVRCVHTPVRKIRNILVGDFFLCDYA